MTLPVTLDHCVIKITNWERSNAFYRDVLGATLVERPAGWAYRFGDRQLNVHGPGVSPAEVARLPVQPGNSDLCFEWNGPIADAIAHLERQSIRGRARADGALRCARRRHQRLFPRSGRLADGIYLLRRHIAVIRWIAPPARLLWNAGIPRGTVMATIRNLLELPREPSGTAGRRRRGAPHRAQAAGHRAGRHRRDLGQPVEARRPKRRLRLSAYRRARESRRRLTGTRFRARAAARRSPAASAIISAS